MTYIVSLFQNLSLTDQHAILYQSLLDLGKATYKELAEKTGIPRSSCYEYVPELLNLGLITEIVEGKKKFLIPESPEKLFELVKAKRKEVDENLKRFEQELPQLISSFQALKDKPSVTFYKGLDGIKLILEETLNLRQEVLVMCQGEETFDTEDEEPDYMTEYLQRFKELKCKSREIIEDRGDAKVYQQKYADDLQQILLAPPLKRKDTTHIDKIIYGNKVAIIMFDKQRAILIEDKLIALNERISFDVLWNALKENKYKYK